MCAVFAHVLYVWQRSVCDFLLELATTCVTQSPNVSTKATRNKRKGGVFFLLPPLDLWQLRPFKMLADPCHSLMPLHVDWLSHSLTSRKTDPLFAKKMEDLHEALHHSDIRQQGNVGQEILTFRKKKEIPMLTTLTFVPELNGVLKRFETLKRPLM